MRINLAKCLAYKISENHRASARAGVVVLSISLSAFVSLLTSTCSARSILHFFIFSHLHLWHVRSAWLQFHTCPRRRGPIRYSQRNRPITLQVGVGRGRGRPVGRSRSVAVGRRRRRRRHQYTATDLPVSYPDRTYFYAAPRFLPTFAVSLPPPAPPRPLALKFAGISERKTPNFDCRPSRPFIIF